MKRILSAIIALIIMSTPTLVSFVFDFNLSLIYGQIAVYILSTLAIILGLWIIKVNLIDTMS
ncbi:MAG: hypothetical protein KGZ38_05510 [Erysipelothrix sp.]|nr:hypothetical protein [Erysipelothrix sp.]